jgi:hypothetical protein
MDRLSQRQIAVLYRQLHQLFCSAANLTISDVSCSIQAQCLAAGYVIIIIIIIFLCIYFTYVHFGIGLWAAE